jgi:uncharacterized cofD-like protein
MEEKTKKRIVVIGGGTGTHTVLSGLKRYADAADLKAIVTVADSGGSSGRLRDEFGYLPVGDVRLALLALAREEDDVDDILRKLFLHRFDRGEGLNGHTFGNLFLVALTDILGSEEAAIAASARILATCGEVIPVTTERIELAAAYDDGRMLIGEHAIDEGHGIAAAARIKELSLARTARANERALLAIASADLIVLGPGDLYTSILANCVVDGIQDALQRTETPLVYVSNLMSRRGQTNGMGTRDYLAELTRYVGRPPGHIIVNTTPMRADLLAAYAAEDEYPVTHDYAVGETTVHGGDLLATDDVILQPGDVLRRSLIRHDPDKLARAIMALI